MSQPRTNRARNAEFPRVRNVPLAEVASRLADSFDAEDNLRSMVSGGRGRSAFVGGRSIKRRAPKASDYSPYQG